MGIPLPEIGNLSNPRFMFFDRYEIHIQAFLYFINGKLIIFNPHLQKNIFKIYIQRIYIQKIDQKYIYKIYIQKIYMYVDTVQECFFLALS